MWKSLSLFLLVALLLCGLSYPPQTYTTVIQPNDSTVEDAWLTSVAPEVEWGNYNHVPIASLKLFVGYVVHDEWPPGHPTSGEYRSIIKFKDLSAVPSDAIVDRAVLTITQVVCQVSPPPPGCVGPDLSISAYRVRTPWQEIHVRWLEMPLFELTPLDTQVVHNVQGVKLNLDITQAFIAWRNRSLPNYGVMLIENPLQVEDAFLRGKAHDDIGCCEDPPGKNGPKITVSWHRDRLRTQSVNRNVYLPYPSTSDAALSPLRRGGA